MDRLPILAAASPLLARVVLCVSLLTLSHTAGADPVSGDPPPSPESLRDAEPGSTGDAAPSADIAGPHGAQLMGPPPLLPGRPPPTDPILALARLAESAAPDKVLHSAIDLARRSHGPDAAAAWMTAGMIHREAHRPRLAAEAFGHARDAQGPLLPWAEWFEAEQALDAGDPDTAHSRCSSAIRRDPAHPRAEACQRLSAIALGRLGRTQAAQAAATAWDEAHPDEPVREAVELALASWEQVHQPQAAIQRYQRLSVWHRTAIAGRRADEGLAALRAQGHEGAHPPDDLAARQARAISMRQARRKDAAWDAFAQLAQQTQDDPALSAWVAREQLSFGWATGRLREVARYFADQYATSPTAQSAWGAYRASTRAGDHAEAAAWIHRGLEAHAGQGSWRGNQDPLARALMLAGDYDQAIQLLDRTAARGGVIGRRASWYAAFCTMMKPDAGAARERLDAIIAQGAHHRTEARYWRARLVEQSDPALAERDRAWIRSHDDGSWYALLLSQPERARGAARTWSRDGRWPDPEHTATAAPSPSPAPPPPAPSPPVASQGHDARGAAPRLATPRNHAARPQWAQVVWPLGSLASTATAVPHPTHLDPYPTSRFHDPTYAAGVFQRFVARWSPVLPELDVIAELTRAGLHDLSGPLMSALFEGLNQRRRHDPAARRVLADTDQVSWRQIFLHTRDHHHATRYSYALERYAEGEEEARRARALALPLAHWRRVRTHGQRKDLDPLLILALMRVESVYHANAVSRVGARGAMQIMPRTGHLLADLRDDIRFSAGDLHDPMLSIDYGVHYLAMLQARFGGVFPYAVASYNGGPHNVSSWLTGRLRGMPLDVWVEHIPFRETRNYVRSVSAQYARYTDIYAPAEATVMLPQRFVQDDPNVVDF